MTAPEPLLLTGGAGYIGSNALLAFLEAGYPVVVLDDLSTGRRAAVPDDVPFVQGDVGDADLVRRLIAEHGIAAAVHFAASISVPESLGNPLLYHRNNSVASGSLIAACLAAGVRRFVFSSTAAVYGIPSVIPVPEDEPTAPINPYGTSKLATEWLLRDVAAAHDFGYVALRYFNVAGADPQGRAGQSNPKSEHLIKVASEAALGLRDGVEVFGADYGTADGTCVRDYIHVSDLAEAHVAALRALENGGDSQVLNCGYGHGFSVREVVEAVRSIAGVPFAVREGPRRPGDPPILVADNVRLREALRWSPRCDNLAFIVRTALDWEEKRARESRSGRRASNGGERRRRKGVTKL